MTDITIPSAALEAGAKYGYRNFEGWLRVDQYGDPIDWEDLTEEQRNECRWQARACFLAMIEAWPGVTPFIPIKGGVGFILPPPPEGEQTDEQTYGSAHLSRSWP